MDIRLGRIPPDSTGYQEGSQKRAKRAKRAEAEPPAADATETVEDCYVPSTEPDDESAE